MVVFVQFSALTETPLFFQVILYIFSNSDTFRIWQTLLFCGSSYSTCSKINVLGYKRFSMCCVPCSGWAHCSPGIAGYCRLGVQYKTSSDGILLSQEPATKAGAPMDTHDPFGGPMPHCFPSHCSKDFRNTYRPPLSPRKFRPSIHPLLDQCSAMLQHAHLVCNHFLFYLFI